MFINTKSKLEDSTILLKLLSQTNDVLEFKALFNSFLNSARAITYALQKEGTNISGFAEWYTIKQDEMKNDELLRYIQESRTIDFHEGKSQLNLITFLLKILDLHLRQMQVRNI